LTDQSGLFTSDRQNPKAQADPQITGKNIPEEIWRALENCQWDRHWGMLTKLQAADQARRSGTTVVIARGSTQNILLRIVQGEQVGTCFSPVVTALEARKRYILAGGQVVGTLCADRGAVEAIKLGKSLLPVGLMNSEGVFDRGDMVQVVDQDGKEVAVGLVNYASRDLSQLSGKQSMEIEKILGYAYGEEVIHRNNMVLL
jgi:glutamate 5-kinase